MLPNRAVTPYIYPAAAFSMLVAVLVGPGIATLATIVLAGLVGVIAGNSFEIAFYTAVGGLVAILAFERRGTFEQVLLGRRVCGSGRQPRDSRLSRPRRHRSIRWVW